MNIDEAFARVVGRPPSEEQRDRLHRLREVLGLRDNDAFWSIVIALEYYDSFFRQYPAQLARETQRCIEGVRAAFAVAAEKETAHVERVLSEKVAETSVGDCAQARREARGASPGDHRARRGGCLRGYVRERGGTTSGRPTGASG